VFEEMRHTVISVVSRIFETMFFVDVQPQEEGKGLWPANGAPPIPPGRDGESQVFIRSEIRFQGPRSGIISLTIPFLLAQKIAKDFMGLEEGGASESQVRDMAGELANIISGNLLPALDKSGFYFLSLPRAEPISYIAADSSRSGSGLIIDFNVDGQSIQFNILFDSKSPPKGL
jgi:CheY-specific phosphatase CheX